MRNKVYFVSTASLFFAVALAHFLRIVFNWPVRIGSLDIPVWLSWLVVIIIGILAYNGFRLQRKS